MRKRYNSDGVDFFRDYYSVSIDDEYGWLKLTITSSIDGANRICLQALGQVFTKIECLQFSENEKPKRSELKYIANFEWVKSSEVGYIVIRNASDNEIFKSIELRFK